MVLANTGECSGITARTREADCGVFDRSIVEVLGMRLEDASRLSDSAFGFIAPAAEDFGALQGQTFQAFLSTTQDGRDAEALLNVDRAGAARFVAARIGKWLEREVLAPQDVLLDVPHLLQRFPFLMGDSVGDPGAWNQAVHEVGWLRETLDEGAWFGPSDCLSRPAVWHQRIEENREIGERRATFDFSVVPSWYSWKTVQCSCRCRKQRVSCWVSQFL